MNQAEHFASVLASARYSATTEEQKKIDAIFVNGPIADYEVIAQLVRIIGQRRIGNIIRSLGEIGKETGT